MAKADLIHLVKQAKRVIQSDTQLMRKYYNKFPHVFIVNQQNIVNQILIQASKKRPSQRQLANINKIAAKYCKKVYDAFKAAKQDTYTYKVFGQSHTDFKVLVTSINGQSDAFQQIKRIRTPFQQVMQNQLVRDVFNKADVKDNLFDLGHQGLSSVAQKKAQQAISRFASFPGLNQLVAGQQGGTAIIASARQYNNQKVFTITVQDQSRSANRSKGTEQKAWVQAHTRAINRFLDSNIDWANQKGSRSKNEIILSQLLGAAVSKGGKTKAKLSKKQSPTKASQLLKSKKNKAVYSHTQINSFGPIQQQADWSSLIGIINAKLTQTVINNMSQPALVNRTGRFASSTRVIGVQSSPQGFPVFVFDYMRQPYDVFDRSLGALPWNTPGRDPKTLIAKSVRQIVSQLATGRFYTRRV